MNIKIVLTKKIYRNGQSETLLELRFDEHIETYNPVYKERLLKLMECLKTSGFDVEYIEKVISGDILF